VKILRGLQALLSGVAKPVRSDVRFLAQVVAIYGVLYFAVSAAFEYWRAAGCITEVRARSIVSGADFEVSETDCWHNPETNVFISKSGQNSKTLLFAYSPGVVPTITAIGDRTIRVGVGDIDQIFCRKGKWESLTIEYDVGGIRYPGNHHQSREC
jgi:hypothetical protein